LGRESAGGTPVASRGWGETWHITSAIVLWEGIQQRREKVNVSRKEKRQPIFCFCRRRNGQRLFEGVDKTLKED